MTRTATADCPLPVSPGGGPRARVAATAALSALMMTMLSACAPEVGSERWCDGMRDKDRGDWSANEALDFARHCLFETED